MRIFVRFLMTASLMAALVLAVSCKDDDKVPSCDEAVDALYDEDCGISVEGYWLSESEAEDFCEDGLDEAEDEGCKGEFETLLKCFVNDLNDCDDCEDEWDDLFDCFD